MLSMPLLGVVWVAALFVACFRVHWFVILLGCSVVFQAGSIVDVSFADFSHGITPYSVCGLWALLLTLKFLLSDLQTSVRYLNDRAIIWLFLYFVFSASSALALPVLFSGVPVYSLTNIAGFDVARVPLALGISQFGQIANTAVHLSVLAFLVIALKHGRYQPRHLGVGICSGAFIVVAIGLYDRVASLQEWPFIGWHFLTNQGYKLAYTVKIGGIDRLSAPFSEPSYSSAYLSAIFIGLATCISFEKRINCGRLILAALVALALVNTLGATGIIAAMVAIIVVLFASSVIALNPSGRWLRRRVVFTWAALLAVVTALLIVLAGNDWLETLLADKWTADSTKYRVRSNVYAFQLVYDTLGLGVGLGGNRASSYFASLLSNVGLMGTGIFICAIGTICVRCYKRQKLFAMGSVFGAVMAVCIGIPDLNIPFFWMFVFAALVQSMPRSAPHDAQIESQTRMDEVAPDIGVTRL